MTVFVVVKFKLSNKYNVSCYMVNFYAIFTQICDYPDSSFKVKSDLNEAEKQCGNYL